MLAVLLSRITCSLYQGLLAMIAGVTVTPPVPLAALIVRLRMVERERLPPDPVIVRVVVPVVAVLAAARVRLLVLPVVEGGLKVAVTPAGRPLTLKATPLEKPPMRGMVIVLAPDAPRLTVRFEGFAEIVKSGVGGAL